MTSAAMPDDAKDDPTFRKLVDNAPIRAVAQELFGLALD